MSEKTIDDYALEAERATDQWYGRITGFQNPEPPLRPLREWFKRHWARFPNASPIKSDGPSD